MSDKLTENFGKGKENRDREFTDIMISEELESFEVINLNEDVTFFGDIKTLNEDNQPKEKMHDNLKDHPDISETQYFVHEESEEEYLLGDIWDDFEVAKPHMQKFDNKQAEKLTKKSSKLQKRRKAMVRYKNITPTVDFDEKTKYLLRRLVTSRYISSYHGIIGTGRRSVVFYGNGSTCWSWGLPFEVVIKVYDNNEASYKRAQNELKSLDRLNRCFIKCPIPVCAWRNIIVMGAIGFVKTAQSITLAPPELDLTHYLHIIDRMQRMYQLAKVVHGNLSRRSILWFGAPSFISLSHSVPTDHPDALKLLIKDCYNVTHLFKEKGLSELKTTEELFKFVTDLPEIDDALLKILENIKPSDSKEISYNSEYPTGKPSANYAPILEFCSKINK